MFQDSSTGELYLTSCSVSHTALQISLPTQEPLLMSLILYHLHEHPAKKLKLQSCLNSSQRKGKNNIFSLMTAYR